MTKNINKELISRLHSLQIEKAKGSWTLQKSETIDIMSCERFILQFVQRDTDRMESVKPISEYCLFDFWKWIQEKKDKLDIEREE